MTDNGKGVHIKTVKSRLHVQCPYSEEFVLLSHALEGRYRRRSKLWSFDRSRYAQVAQGLNRIFGTSINVIDARRRQAGDTEGDA